MDGKLILEMLAIPFLYWGVMRSYCPFFWEEKNQNRRIFASFYEILAVFLAMAALFTVWKTESSGILRDLLFVMLTAMTVFCITDIWEWIVPNRLLVILLFLFFIIVGFHGVKDMDAVIRLIPGILLGFTFCLLTFVPSYLLSRGSMGAGDVKLALVMGLYLTGEYVVGSIFYGCMVAAGYSLIQLVRKKLTRKDAIPFVPFLYVGLIIRCLMGMV